MRSSVHQRIAAGIARQSDVWMAREALGQCHRVLLRPRRSASVLTARTARKCFEGAGCCTRELPTLPQSRQQICIAHGDHAAKQIRVTTDELRYRLHGHVGPERQRILIERRSEGVVVHSQDRATLLSTILLEQYGRQQNKPHEPRSSFGDIRSCGIYSSFRVTSLPANTQP